MRLFKPAALAVFASLGCTAAFAQMSDSQLTSDINTNLPTTGAGAITAAKLRSVLIDIVNNKVNNQPNATITATNLGTGFFKASGTMQGSIGSTGGFAPFWLDMIDNIDGGNIYSGLFTSRVNSTAASGARNGLTGQTIIQSPSSPSNPAQFYVGVSGATIAGTGDNGTAVTHRGNIYGLAGQCIMQNGAMYYNTCQGMNVSLIMHTGSESAGRVGYSAEADGEVGGTLIDAAYDVFANSAPWFTGFFIDDTGFAGYPIATGGTILKGGIGAPVTRALNAGIDFSMLGTAWSGTGNAIILPAGNGGIQWGSAGGGGGISSGTSTGGMVEAFRNGSVTFDSAGVTKHFFDAAGNLTSSARISGTNFQTTPVTVASLPACNSGVKGLIASVSDAAATPVYNATVAGGGSVSIPVYCNGTNWTNH